MTEAQAAGTAAASLWLIVVVPLTLRLLTALKMVRPNFRGDGVPVGAGLAVIAWSAPALLAWPPQPRPAAPDAMALLVVLCAFGALGFIDDRWGDRSSSGLRGHFRRLLLEGRVTTGALKAIGGVGVGVATARFGLGAAWPEALLSGAVIALSANALNLLDLRPGRAGAALLIAAVPLLAAGWTADGPPALALVWLPAFALYAWDRRGLAMMGDTGSNALGASLGLSLCAALPTVWLIATLAALTTLHLAAERSSLSELIDRSPLLRRVDGWTGVRGSDPDRPSRV